MKNWFITGASSGLGRCIAEAALRRGDCVAAVATHPEKMHDLADVYGERVWVKRLDVTDETMVQSVFAQAVRTFGHIDVCVNNAGYMHLGAVEELSGEEMRRIMDTNYMGCFYVSREAAAHMRRAGKGIILQMSSLAGIDVLAGNAAYGASKFAMEGMSLALAREMEPFGVRVAILEPGTIKTGIARRSRHSAPIADYEEMLAADRHRWVDGDDSNDTGDPLRCAEIVLRLADMEKPPLHLPMTTLSYEIAKTVYKERLEELDTWQEYCRMADFAEPADSGKMNK